jgi:hypothetical protein
MATAEANAPDNVFERLARAYIEMLHEIRSVLLEITNARDQMLTWAIGLMGAGLFSVTCAPERDMQGLNATGPYLARGSMGTRNCCRTG